MGLVQRPAGMSRDWGKAGAAASLVQFPTQAAGERGEEKCLIPKFSEATTSSSG